MPLTTMYVGRANSPKTSLASSITASATTIPVNDITVFPHAPNLAVIGTGEDAEVVLYSDVTDNKLTNVVRAVSDTVAKAWPAGTSVARNFTLLDYKTLCDNITYLDSVKRESTSVVNLSSEVTGTLPYAKGGTGITSNPSMIVNLESGSNDNVFKASPKPGVTGILPKTKGGTGLTAAPSMVVNLGVTTAADIFVSQPKPGVSGTLGLGNGGTGVALNAAPSMLVNLGSTTAASIFASAPKPGVTGTLKIANGGTGAATAADARTNLGAAAANHTHNNYLPLTGGTLTGTVKLIPATGEGGQIELHAASNATEQAGTIIDNYGSKLRVFGIASADGTTKKGIGTVFEINPYDHTFGYGYTFLGNFGTLTVANGGTGLTSAPSMLVNLGSTTAASIFASAPRPGVTGTLKVGNGGTGATTAADARTNLGISAIATRPDYTVSTTDLTPGTSSLASGKLYFVYEA